MPLILLLDQQLGIIRAGVKKTASIGDVFARAASVLTRRRAAFVTSWFGDRVPIEGIDIRVSVVNSGPILERIGDVRRMQAQYEASVAGPNLADPIAGITGTVAGGFLGVVLGGIAVLTLLFVAGGPNLPVGLVIATMVVVDAVLATLSGLRAWRRYRDLRGRQSPSRTGFMGGVLAEREAGASRAALAQDAISWGNDALADRDQVRDPVRRAVLTLADRLAGMVTRVLGAAAVFLEMVPVVAILDRARQPLVELAGHLRELVVAAVTSVHDAVLSIVRSSGLLTPGLMFQQAMRQITDRGLVVFTAVLPTLTAPISNLRTEGQAAAAWLRSLVEPITTEHPVVRFLGGLTTLPAALGQVGAMLRRAGSRMGARLVPDSVRILSAALSSIIGSSDDGNQEEESSSGIGGKLTSWGSRATGVDRAMQRGRQTRQAAGSLALVPTVAEHGLTATLAPTLLDLARDDLASRPMFVVGSVPRVFAAERARVIRRGERLVHDEAFRTATLVLQGAAAIAGPMIESEVTQLSTRLAEIEAPLRSRLRSLPVRDIPPPRHLLPTLRRVRVSGGRDDDEPRLRAWTSRFIDELSRTPIAAAPSTAGAAS